MRCHYKRTLPYFSIFYVFLKPKVWAYVIHGVSHGCKICFSFTLTLSTMSVSILIDASVSGMHEACTTEFSFAVHMRSRTDSWREVRKREWVIYESWPRRWLRDSCASPAKVTPWVWLFEESLRVEWTSSCLLSCISSILTLCAMNLSFNV